MRFPGGFYEIRNDYGKRLCKMTLKETKRYHRLKFASSPKNQWWYTKGFATGLLLLDEGDTAEMHQELAYMLELMKDMENIAIEDGLPRDFFIPAAFTVGMKHAMCIADVSQVPIVRLQTKRTLVRSGLRRKAFGKKKQDEITFIKIGPGHLAIRPRPFGQQLVDWKPDVLVTLSESHQGTKRMRHLKAMVDKVPSVQWIPLQFHILSGKSQQNLRASDLETLQFVDVLLAKLKDGQTIVVHCHAGLHRSGFFVYVLLRRHGLSAPDSIEALRKTRKLTFDEMTYPNKKNRTLAQEAEQVFQTLSFGPCEDF